MDFQQLAQLEHLRSLASQKEMAALQHKEAQLRQQLEAIRAFRTELHAPDPELRPMRAIGADILWNKWLDQTKVSLNMSLARVLAQKENVARKVRKDVGRAETVKDLRVQADQAAAAAMRKTQMEKLMALSVQQGLARR